MYYFKAISLAAFSVGVNFKKTNRQRITSRLSESRVATERVAPGSRHVLESHSPAFSIASHVDLATVSGLGQTLLRRL